MNQQNDDEKARVDFFNALYKENYIRVYNFVCRSQMRMDTKLAEDITQSTFCEAWNKLDTLLTHPNRNGWLMETAKKKYWSQWKKKSSKEEVKENKEEKIEKKSRKGLFRKGE